MIAGPVQGWVFVGFPDEHLRTMLREGTVRLWDDARTIGKVPGQPVLFLQTREQGAAWVGAGVVTDLEERWKAFGVYVQTRTVLARMLPVSSRDARNHPTAQATAVEAIRARGPAAWENRTLAARLGFMGFQTHTPYLEDTRDLRLSDSDWSVLCQLQPSLLGLIPR